MTRVLDCCLNKLFEDEPCDGHFLYYCLTFCTLHYLKAVDELIYSESSCFKEHNMGGESCIFNCRV